MQVSHERATFTIPRAGIFLGRTVALELILNCEVLPILVM